MAKKPDYSSSNIPLLTEYCLNNELFFEWKNKTQGHAVIYNDEIEAYVWVQRMVIGVRKRNGVELSKVLYERSPDSRFGKKFMNHLLFNAIDVSTHTTHTEIKVVRIPARKI